MTQALLELRGVSAGYGALCVVWDITLQILPGEWAVLVGASGAGKTTLMRAIAGLNPVLAGTLSFAGHDITHLPAHRRVRAGLSMVPEGRRLFAGMSVAENLMLGGFTEDSPHERADRLSSVYDLFPVLAARRHQIAGTLSGGEQQMCAIGRALMSNPKLLIIDELSLGLAPAIIDTILETLAPIRDRGTALFVIDQDVSIGVGIADSAYVIRSGHIVMSGEANAVLCDPALEREYIGG